MLVVAPLTGLPYMTLRRMISGQPMPEDFQDWYFSSMSYGPGTPMDIYRSTTTAAMLTNNIFGSYGIPAELITSTNKPRATSRALPYSRIWSNWLFPPKSWKK